MKHNSGKDFMKNIWNEYKILFLVVLLLSVAWLLYPTPQSHAKKAGQTELTFWLPAVQIDRIRPAVEEFERRNKDIRVLIGSATVRDGTGDPTRFLLRLHALHSVTIGFAEFSISSSSRTILNTVS